MGWLGPEGPDGSYFLQVVGSQMSVGLCMIAGAAVLSAVVVASTIGWGSLGLAFAAAVLGLFGAQAIGGRTLKHPDQRVVRGGFIAGHLVLGMGLGFLLSPVHLSTLGLALMVASIAVVGLTAYLRTGPIRPSLGIAFLSAAGVPAVLVLGTWLVSPAWSGGLIGLFTNLAAVLTVASALLFTSIQAVKFHGTAAPEPVAFHVGTMGIPTGLVAFAVLWALLERVLA
jgi:hypothetical protein